MTERKPPRMSIETWVEGQIAQGMARGQFDGLAGAGRPLSSRALDDRTGYEWVLEKARRENLDVFGMLPPGLALRKERDDLFRRAAALPSEDAVRALAEDYNARVREFWRRPQESRWSPVPGLADVEALAVRWRQDHPPAPPPPVEPVRPPRRRRFPWLFRRRS